jgi:hypothetical protein
VIHNLIFAGNIKILFNEEGVNEELLESKVAAPV